METTKSLVDIAHIKRFIERFNSDGRFRPEFINDPARGMQTLGLSIDPDVVRPIWDQTLEGNDRYDGRPLLAEYRKFYDEKMSLNHQVKHESNPSDSMMNTWRNRQIARLSTQIIDMNADLLVHAPVAFELSKGCSVGCYFCSLSAPKLTDVWAYNSANQYLWRDSLQAIKEVLGTAAQWGFCYWATDPLDNPDYEHFCVDFAEILGRFPQTTTAKPLVSVERTKRLLALSQQYSPKIINRFSILTNRSLHKVHESFTPEELLRVELVTLNPDSETVKTKSGRMWHIAQEKPKVWDKEVSRLRRVKLGQKFTEEQWETFFKSLDERTCSCVSGFLLNMVDRTV